MYQIVKEMPKEFLLSDKSEKLKFFKSLVDDPLARHKDQKCIVFGEKILSEGLEVEAYITTPSKKDDPFFALTDCYIISEKAFKHLSGLVTPEPYGAVIKMPNFKFPKTIKRGLLILDRLNDPGNLGTIFRTALGFALDGVILLKPCVDPYHPKVLRSSKGCSLKMPWVKLEESELFSFLKTYNLPVFCADLDGENLHKTNHKGPFALIMGNESSGVSPGLKAHFKKIHIPQNHLESYNVAIACAIIGYTLMTKEDL